MSSQRLRRITLGLAVMVPAGPLAAQLTLAGALRHADAGAPAIRIADETAAASDAQRLVPLRGILPSIRIDGGYVRTTGPMAAFGTQLAQRGISQADFDPASLNWPAPIGNYTGGVVAEQPHINLDSWRARRAATHAAKATRASSDWTRLSTHADVIGAYYGAVLAAERVTTLDAAAAAAQAHVRQAEAMVRAGMATRSDALLASVKAGEIEAQQVEARSEAAIARRQLALLIGQASDNPILPSRLPSSSAIQALAAADTLDQPLAGRADVGAAQLGMDAARADLQRARSLYLPRLNAFARYDWNSPQHLYGGDKSWTVGVLASWSPFAGASQHAETQVATARLNLATTVATVASDQAQLDVERSRASLRSALTRLELADRAVRQSIEAHRIVSRKYEGGLATVVELLDAAAVETQSRLSLSSSRYAAITATANRRHALGKDPATLIDLERADLAGASH